jgi:alkanesulfonate monooxygenase SsuD/methylene tetrahydromethanopterin reductase-like flavin-dependent oxidoreductase (luciferase family)
LSRTSISASRSECSTRRSASRRISLPRLDADRSGSHARGGSEPSDHGRSARPGWPATSGGVPAAGPRTHRLLRSAAGTAHRRRRTGGAADGRDGPVRAIPAEGNRPPLWLLGSTPVSARVAGTLGLPYTFAHHQRPTLTLSALAAYRAAFRPSLQLRRPRVMLSVSVTAAATDENAHELAQSSQRSSVHRPGSPAGPRAPSTRLATPTSRRTPRPSRSQAPAVDSLARCARSANDYKSSSITPGRTNSS